MSRSLHVCLVPFIFNVFHLSMSPLGKYHPLDWMIVQHEPFIIRSAVKLHSFILVAVPCNPIHSYLDLINLINYSFVAIPVIWVTQVYQTATYINCILLLFISIRFNLLSIHPDQYLINGWRDLMQIGLFFVQSFKFLINKSL